MGRWWVGAYTETAGLLFAHAPQDAACCPPFCPFGQDRLGGSYLYLAYDGAASSFVVEEAKQRAGHSWYLEPFAREWEFLGHERIEPESTEQLGPFEVSMGMLQRPLASTFGYEDYLLGMHVRGPAIDAQSRPGVVLTLLIDVSSSMTYQVPGVGGESLSKLELARLALAELPFALAPGDIVNVITFDSGAKIEIEGAMFSDMEPKLAALDQVSRRLRSRAGEGFDGALVTAYKVARRHYAPDRWNQIVVVTDAYFTAVSARAETLLREANASLPGRGIRWSSIGVGQEELEEVLRPLSILGKGSYFTAITRQDMARIFRERFSAIFGPVARNIRFRIDFPEVMQHTSAARRSWQSVKDTDFPYNDEHTMFESFRAPEGLDVSNESFTLTISYEHPETGERLTKTTTHRVADLLGRNTAMIRTAEVIHLFVELLAEAMTKDQVGAILQSYSEAPELPLFQEYDELIRRLP